MRHGTLLQFVLIRARLLTVSLSLPTPGVFGFLEVLVTTRTITSWLMEVTPEFMIVMAPLVAPASLPEYLVEDHIAVIEIKRELHASFDMSFRQIIRAGRMDICYFFERLLMGIARRGIIMITVAFSSRNEKSWGPVVSRLQSAVARCVRKILSRSVCETTFP